MAALRLTAPLNDHFLPVQSVLWLKNKIPILFTISEPD